MARCGLEPVCASRYHALRERPVPRGVRSVAGSCAPNPLPDPRMTIPGSELRYVLVTPARNEQDYIEGTIRSVVDQTHRPTRWIIVSDGSTDRTDEIVKRYTREYDWIELLRMPEHRDRTFAAKATCFNAGYERLKTREFDIIGNLDADITFPSDYCAFLLGKFAQMPALGVAGTPFVEDGPGGGHSYNHRHSDLEHVSGACQMFRRECLDQVGGYPLIKGGGIDWVAVTTARMKGWQTRTFVEMACLHHRKMGTADRGSLMARFRHGQEDYCTGRHPLWQVFRSAFQMTKPPFVVGGVFLMLGYIWAMAKRTPRPVSAELIAFHRAEQMNRLRKLLF
jgi:glycosyltransferase involved in cell wall biosynthesis